MIKEIKEKYKGFHDALILGINYQVGYRDKKTIITIDLQAFNHIKDRWEQIRLIFIDVIKFRFSDGKFENKSICSTVVFEAYINETDNVVVFDFFALQVDGHDILAEDPNSDLIVHCKALKFVLLDTAAT